MKSAFLLIGLCFEAALLLWTAVVAGQKADARFKTGGGITILLVLLALLLWGWQLMRLLKTAQKGAKK